MTESSIGDVYFQQQSSLSLQCGRHTVNHILGGPFYSKEDMNSICYELSDEFINPHKHVFGGDYDINVLMMALQRHQMNTNWFDKRNQHLQVPQNDKKQQLVGFLVNVHVDSNFGLFMSLCSLSKRHWFAIRRIGKLYYWLDSKQERPIAKNAQDTDVELNRLLRSGPQEQQAQILIVTRQ